VGEAPPALQGVSTGALFAGFLKVGLSGFGGVLPFARRMVVEQRRWLTEQEFTEVMSLAQFLPGPNVVNASVIIGRRFGGARGALVASLGLMLMPLVIVLVLAALFAHFADIAAVRGACRGVSAAASGLVLATALKMSQPIRRTGWQVAIGAIVFVAIALARLSMLWVLAALVPVSLGLAWRKPR
jgi:chromate transporter